MKDKFNRTKYYISELSHRLSSIQKLDTGRLRWMGQIFVYSNVGSNTGINNFIIVLVFSRCCICRYVQNIP